MLRTPPGPGSVSASAISHLSRSQLTRTALLGTNDPKICVHIAKHSSVRRNIDKHAFLGAGLKNYAMSLGKHFDLFLMLTIS